MNQSNLDQRYNFPLHNILLAHYLPNKMLSMPLRSIKQFFSIFKSNKNVPVKTSKPKLFNGVIPKLHTGPEKDCFQASAKDVKLVHAKQLIKGDVYNIVSNGKTIGEVYYEPLCIFCDKLQTIFPKHFFEENGTNRNCQHLTMESAPSPAIIEKRLIHHELSGYLWNKMFRRECCGDIDFPSDITLLEDELFIIRVLRTGNIKRVAYLPKAFYHYRTDNTSSIIHVRSERNLQSLYKVLHYLLENSGAGSTSDDWIIERKMRIMNELFRMKRFKQLMSDFVEVHQKIIDEQPHWNIRRPEQSGLSMALQGKPCLGFLFCVINEYLIIFTVRIKMLLHRINK